MSHSIPTSACYKCAYRPAGEGELYWRIAQFLFPFYAHIPTGTLGEQILTRAWVPMDDTHTMFFSFGARSLGAGFGSLPVKENSTDWFGRFRPLADQTNDYLIDREVQRTRDFTGIPGIHTQDKAITESMGPILNRERERPRHSGRDGHPHPPAHHGRSPGPRGPEDVSGHDGSVTRALLILPTATYRAPEFLDAARRLSVEVVTGSERPQALAQLMGDRFIELPLEDPERAAGAIVELAARGSRSMRCWLSTIKGRSLRHAPRNGSASCTIRPTRSLPHATKR